MQQATIIQATRRLGGSVKLRSILVLAVAVTALTAVWANSYPSPAATPTASYASMPPNRIFADEAAFVPDAATYANLAVGEDYLPLTRPVAHTVQPISMPRSLIFRDELAGASHPQPAIDAIATRFVERIVSLNGPR